jgi:signal transduction histidine kinase
MNPRWAKIALLAGAAVFTGTVLTLELYFNSRAMMESVDLADIALPQFGRAIMWALQVPWIFRLQQQIRLDRGHRLSGYALHAAASVTVMATFYLGRLFFYSLIWQQPLDGFWRAAAAGFYGRNMVDIAFYWATVGLSYSFGLYQRFKSEELKAAQLEARLVETELKALRQQMHPHFLFNTMNTVAVLVREGRTGEAVTLLSRLSSLLRMSLDQTGVPEVTLRQELDFLERYIEIQQMRFSDRLTVTVDIAPDAMNARIPNLLLQPLVENAILHGVAPKTGPGRVDVRGRIEDGDVHLEVRDDGPGLPAGAGRTREGIGLANTRERLTKIYGARGRMVLRSSPGQGVVVEIVLPFRS